MKSQKGFGSIVLRAVLDLLKGAVAAIAGTIGMLLGSMIAKGAGIPMPAQPAYVDPARLLPLMLLCNIPLAIALGECYRKLPFKYGQRVAALFLSNYILYSLANMLDAFLYNPMPHLATNLFIYIFPALLASLIIAVLWRPAAQALPAIGWRSLLANGSLWRFAAAWLGYVPIYYLIGLLVAPFTKSYYTDPSHSLGLVLPPLWAILLMQIPRGLLFLLAVLPLLRYWPGSRMALWLWTGAVIFIQVANAAIFQAYWLPPIVRIPHGLELLTDSFLQAALYVLLLVPAHQAAANSLVENGVRNEPNPIS